jgi:hypothetical protein
MGLWVALQSMMNGEDIIAINLGVKLGFIPVGESITYTQESGDTRGWHMRKSILRITGKGVKVFSSGKSQKKVKNRLFNT